MGQLCATWDEKTKRWLQALILPSHRIISSNNRLLVYSASAAASAITSSHLLAPARRPPPEEVSIGFYSQIFPLIQPITCPQLNAGHDIHGVLR
jgi:hypothetical protein